MRETLIWIVGRGGLLGSHLWRVLSQHMPCTRLWESSPRQFSWTEPMLLTEELSHAVKAFAATAISQNGAWAVLWCAGIGVMSSSAAALEPEWLAWRRLLDLLGQHLAGPCDGLPGSIFLASSAGGVYGGSFGEFLTEDTPPRPVSDYGIHKLHMEEALRSWTGTFGNVSSLIGRISSLYGPGQNLGKAQGIISHLSRCMIHRRPVNLYVPLDTRRDYLFAADCAHQVGASLGRLLTERPRSVLKVFASEELTSLARIVAVFFRMAKHRPLIVTQQPHGAQPASLKLRSVVWRNLRCMRRTDLAAGIHIVHEHQLALFCHGLLPPPS
jgi:UDP-glucose 4-epimerase